MTLRLLIHRFMTFLAAYKMLFWIRYFISPVKSAIDKMKIN